jgi:hypothetical protein
MGGLTRLKLGWTKCIAESLADLVSDSGLVLLMGLGALLHEVDGVARFF